MLPERFFITVRDGTRLAADLYLPTAVSAEAPTAALLEALPYRKDDLTASSHSDDYRRLRDEGGFAVCRLDVRGTGSSEGLATDEYPPVELDDLADVIAWLAGQPWSNGRVGMFGYSYSGFNSLQAACERPPGLAAICAIYATDDRYTDDVHYMGGALRAIDLIDYCHYMTASNALPPVPAVFGPGWRDEWQRRLDDGEPWMLRWLTEQHDGPYWHHGSVRPGYDRIACPTMLVGGWADGYRNNTVRTFEALRCPKSLLVGPWSHMSPATSLPGPHIDLVPEMIRWFDRWLRDNDNGVDTEPSIRVFMRHATPPEPDLAMVNGEWRSEDTWPPAHLRHLILSPPRHPVTSSVVERSAISTSVGPVPRDTVSGGPVLIEMATVQPDVVPIVLRADVGTAAWISCAGGLPWGQALDQREDDAWSMTEDWPVTEPIEVLGHVRLRLALASDRPVASLSAKLCDVSSDGTSALVTRGFLNLTHRLSSTEPGPLVPGEFVDVGLELEATSWVFEPGHRIRLALAGADWPNTWVAPGMFTLSVDRASIELSLPVLPPAGANPPYFAPVSDALAPGAAGPPAETAASSQTSTPADLAAASSARAAISGGSVASSHTSTPAGLADRTGESAGLAPVWRIERDVLARTTVARTRYGGPVDSRDDGHGFESYAGEVGVSRVDPSRGWADAITRYELTWPEAACAVEARLRLTSDDDSLHVEIELDADLDGEPVARRRWTQSIPRRWM